MNVDRLLFLTGALLHSQTPATLDAHQVVDAAAKVLTEVERRASESIQLNQAQLDKEKEDFRLKFEREAPLRQKLADRAKGIYEPTQ
jgi:hypothetical protein